MSYGGREKRKLHRNRRCVALMMTRTRTRTATNSFLLKLQQFFQVSRFARSRRTANLRPRRVSTHTFNNCCVSLFRSQQQHLSSFQKGEKYNQTLRYVGQQQPRTGSGISPSGDNLPRHRTHLQMLTNISTRKREKNGGGGDTYLSTRTSFRRAQKLNLFVN